MENSAVRYLKVAYDKTTASEIKTKLNNPLHKIGGSDIYGLMGFVKRCKTSRVSILNHMVVTPLPMPIHVELRISGRSSDTNFFFVESTCQLQKPSSGWCPCVDKIGAHIFY